MRFHPSELFLYMACAIVGAAVFFSCPANASPQIDPQVADHAYSIEAGVCAHLSSNPTVGEVADLAAAELQLTALTPRQSGQAFAVAIEDGCPQYLPLVVRWAESAVGANGSNA